jgi:hypothetical protein
MDLFKCGDLSSWVVDIVAEVELKDDDDQIMTMTLPGAVRRLLFTAIIWKCRPPSFASHWMADGKREKKTSQGGSFCRGSSIIWQLAARPTPDDEMPWPHWIDVYLFA